MIDEYRVTGRTAIVTGSSRGIGKRIAERFAHDGANVVVCSRSQSDSESVADTITTNSKGRAIGVACDVRDRDQVESLVEATVDEFGAVDTLVNNAGAGFMAAFEAITPNGWDAVIGTNLGGTYHCSQVIGEQMRADAGGVIINIASYAGYRGSAHMSHYAAANAAIINFTISLAYEWAPENIRVNCIAPGFVATPGVASQMGVTADDIDRDDVNRQIGTPDEIAAIAQFLASPASSYIVGETITAKGLPRMDHDMDLVNPPHLE